MGGKYAAWEAGEITPEAVLAHKAPTEGFLCPLAANKYGIDFREFEIKDYDKVSSSLRHVCILRSGRAVRCARVCRRAHTSRSRAPSPSPTFLLPS